jgi:hypothetical protein
MGLIYYIVLAQVRNCFENILRSLVEFNQFWCHGGFLFSTLSIFSHAAYLDQSMSRARLFHPHAAVARLAANPLIASSGALPGAALLIFKFQHRTGLCSALGFKLYWPAASLMASCHVTRFPYFVIMPHAYTLPSARLLEFPRRPLLVG